MNRRNVTRLASIIVVVSFVLSTFVSLWSLRLMTEQNLQELSKTLAAHIYDSISGELSETITISRTMANDCFLIEALKNEAEAGEKETSLKMARYLTRLKNALNCEAAFVVSQASKCYYSYGGLNKQMDLARSDRDQWYTQFIASDKEYELDVDRDELSQDQWTVFVDARIEDERGRLLGACGVGARMTGSQALFDSLEREYGVRINLIGADGLIHVDTDESRIENTYLEGIRIGDDGGYSYQKLGSGRFAVTKYVENLDWYLVVQSNDNNQRGQFINVLLLNVVLYGFVLVIMLLAIRIIVARTRALTSASFVDQATQLLNRRAFEEKKAALAMSPLNENFVYMTADLNGLKAVNDNLGHAAGDELIRGAADCLKKCFGPYGDVYRIGGDEFAAMLILPEDKLEKAVADLDAAMADWSGKQVRELSISCGYATSREFPSENIAELSRISDERMYAAKEEHYRKTGNARRR